MNVYFCSKKTCSNNHFVRKANAVIKIRNAAPAFEVSAD